MIWVLLQRVTRFARACVRGSAVRSVRGRGLADRPGRFLFNTPKCEESRPAGAAKLSRRVATRASHLLDSCALLLYDVLKFYVPAPEVHRTTRHCRRGKGPRRRTWAPAWTFPTTAEGSLGLPTKERRQRGRFRRPPRGELGPATAAKLSRRDYHGGLLCALLVYPRP